MQEKVMVPDHGLLFDLTYEIVGHLFGGQSMLMLYYDQLKCRHVEKCAKDGLRKSPGKM